MQHFKKSDILKENTLIIYLFILILLLILLFWIIIGNNHNGISLIEGRELEKYSLEGLGFKSFVIELSQGNLKKAGEMFDDLFVQGSFQEMVERASSDQFPLRIRLISMTKALDRQIIKLSYVFLPDPAIPTDMHSDFFVLRDESTIIYNPNKFDQTTKKYINSRVDNYYVLTNSYPNINFYAYHLERIQYSKWNPLNEYFPEADAGQALEYFEANKPPGLTMEKLLVLSFEDYYKYYFRTDHHWNVRGVQIAYEGIYQMLHFNNPEMSDRIDLHTTVEFPNIEFLGYTARNSFYPIKGDKFEVFSVDLPKYKMIRNGTEVSKDNSNDYLNGKYSTEPYIDHYGKFYGGNAGFLEFVFENNSNRNLLIIADSFIIAIQTLLASHYDHTYVINPSRYGDIFFSELLSNYQIDDVLLLGSNNVIFSDPSLVIHP